MLTRKTSPSLATNLINRLARERKESEKDAISLSSAFSYICEDVPLFSNQRDPEANFGVGFCLDVSFREFFEAEIDDPEDFGNMLCLTFSGNPWNSFASTCKQYATRFWGDEEWRLAQRVAMACKIIGKILGLPVSRKFGTPRTRTERLQALALSNGILYFSRSLLAYHTTPLLT